MKIERENNEQNTEGKSEEREAREMSGERGAPASARTGRDKGEGRGFGRGGARGGVRGVSGHERLWVAEDLISIHTGVRLVAIWAAINSVFGPCEPPTLRRPLIAGDIYCFFNASV